MATMTDKKRLEEIAACEERFVKVAGAAGCGKTGVLVERVRALLESGVPAASVLVLATTRTASDELAARLHAASGLAEGVKVSTPYELAVEILGSEHAQARTGRSPRVLEDFEERILVEDLKVLGIKPGRLREMLKFFFRQYSELADESEDFLQSTEEHLLADALAGHLAARGAMLKQELTGVAAKYLRDAEPGQAGCTFDYVLGDDFHNYSKATQAMLASMAQKQLFVCGNANQTVRTVEEYPYPDGFLAFAQDHAGTVEFELDGNSRSGSAIVEVGNAFAAQEGMSAATCTAESGAPGEVRVVQWTLPNAEFVHVSDYVVSRVKGDRDPVHPRDVFIAVPNALWGRAFAKVLGEAGVKTATMLSYHALAGDPRDEAKCANLALFTALNLAARSQDAAAWRNWCGFGDYLTHSNHWCRLEDYASERGMGVVEVLAELAQAAEGGHGEEPFLGAFVLAQKYREGRAMLDGAAGKSGFSLLEQLAGGREGLPAGFEELISPVDGTESAQELFERARAHAEIQFPDEDAVRIGLPQMAVGQQFDTVVVAGFVDGFYPPMEVFGIEMEDDRKAQVVQEMRRALYLVTQAARKTLIFSCFARDDAVSATKLGMRVRRIRDIDGKRMGILSPSSYLDELADAAPGVDTHL